MYSFNVFQSRSTDYQPLKLFKLNLVAADTPGLTTEAEGGCGIKEFKHSNNIPGQSVQKPKAMIKTLENVILVKDRLKDDVNKL